MQSRFLCFWVFLIVLPFFAPNIPYPYNFSFFFSFFFFYLNIPITHITPNNAFQLFDIAGNQDSKLKMITCDTLQIYRHNSIKIILLLLSTSLSSEYGVTLKIQRIPFLFDTHSKFHIYKQSMNFEVARSALTQSLYGP